MKNILYYGLSTRYLSEENIKRINRELKIDSYYGVYSSEKPKLNDCKALLDFWKLIDNDFSDYPIEEIALDDILLNKVSKYDMQILYMYKRCKKKYRDFETAKNAYYSQLKYWNSFIEKGNIKVVFFSNIPHEICDYIIYVLCEIKKIPLCTSDNLSVYDNVHNRRIYLTSIYYQDKYLMDTLKLVKNKYKNKNEDEIVLSSEMNSLYLKMLNESRKKKQEEIKTVFTASSRIKEIERYSGRLNFNINELKKDKFYFLRYLWRIYKYLDLKNKTEKLIKHYNSLSKAPDMNKKYIYVPLHFTPECTSCPQGGGLLADQALFIDILSSSIPNDCYIYVKEHPTQTAYGRDVSFYDRITKLKNVVLVKENTSSYDLMRNCIAVSTLTGTSGYEAQYFFKPFIMFGYYISMFAPGTIHVRTVDECMIAIRKIMNKEIKFSMKDIKVYLKFIEEISVINDKQNSETIDKILYLLKTNK